MVISLAILWKIDEKLIFWNFYFLPKFGILLMVISLAILWKLDKTLILLKFWFFAKIWSFTHGGFLPIWYFTQDFYPSLAILSKIDKTLVFSNIYFLPKFDILPMVILAIL